MERNQITAILYGLVAVLQINKTVLFWFCVVMGIDMILGAVKSIVIPELKFSTKRFFSGMMRKLALIALILLCATLGKGLGFSNLESLITVVIRILMISEGISAFYCFKSIWTGKEEKPADFISKFIDLIIKYLNNKIEKLIKFIDDNSNCNK